ncbi:DUF3107 domain-containing protein [Skermania piniformis]|uniref:DUF3107 domain-containing protein n=1 Tax=Skermania pinensis TaxID=39122 RepID=A0ABX8S4W4_9ACTN|nr:DUF3107 domain-containing protein [Skermania piniformis]QXQ12873.1 DUF3107 domain-containing protein [Skermania piniformis]
MEVKIGIADSPRELVVQSEQSPAEVEKLVTAALAGDTGVVALTDEKGRKYLIQSAKVSYVEIGSTAPARVGFATT